MKNPQSTKNILSACLLATLLVVSLCLRLPGLHDFPKTDESAILGPAYRMSEKLSLDPENYNRPNHVSIYLNFLAQNAWSLIQYHQWSSSALDPDSPELTAVARFLTALWGTLMVLFAFLIGREFRPSLGWIFAVLVALFPLFVEHSQFVTPDIPLACLFLAMVWVALRDLARKNHRHVALSVLCALSIVEKYPGLLFFGIIVAVLALEARSSDGFSLRVFLRRSAIYLGLVVLLCYLISPSLFIHPKQTIRAILAESGGHLGADGLGWGGNLLFYAQTFLDNGGLGVTLMAVAGLITFGISRDRRSDPRYWFLFAGFGYWLILSALSLHWVRWGIPMFFSALFLAGMAMDRLWSLGNWVRWLSLPLLLWVLGNFVVLSGRVNLLFSYLPTVEVARLDAQTRGLTSENTIFEGYTAFHQMGPRSLDWFSKKDDPQYQWVMISAGMKDRYLAEPGRDPQRVKAYHEIMKLPLVQTIKPDPLPGPSWWEPNNWRFVGEILPQTGDRPKKYKGPTIWIYQISR